MEPFILRRVDTLSRTTIFPKIPMASEIIYCTDGLCGRKIYMVWNNMLYEEGYAETLIGGDRRHLADRDLEQAGRYFWHVVFETPRKTE